MCVCVCRMSINLDQPHWKQAGLDQTKSKTKEETENSIQNAKIPVTIPLTSLIHQKAMR